MKNLTTPQAILFGFGLLALAIASIPFSSQIIKPAFAFTGSDLRKAISNNCYVKETTKNFDHYIYCHK